MQDQWFGDEGDFVKFSLLRRLCGITAPAGGDRLSLGVVWYKREPKKLDYLEPREGARVYETEDRDLFWGLRGWVQDDRSRGVSLIENSWLFPSDTVWFSETVPDRNREKWLNRALAAVEGCRVVFLDPDVGLRPEKGRSVDDYVLPDELEQFSRLGHRTTVVVYQSPWHMERTRQIERQIKRQADHIRDRMVAVQHERLKDRFFYVIPSTGDDGGLALSRIAEPFEVIG